MNLLLTGSSGYLGKEITSYFKNLGDQVFPVTRNQIQSMEKPPCDLSEKTWFVHTSAISNIQTCESDSKKAFDVNVTYTKEALKYALEHKIQGFLFFSTAQVYPGTESKIELLNENAPLLLDQVYAKTKHQAEVALQEHGKDKECTIITFRLSNLYSDAPKPDTVMHKVFSQMKEGRPSIQVWNTHSVRDYLHTLDLCDAIQAATNLHKPGKPEIYNLGTGNSTSVLDLISVFSKTLQLPQPEVIVTNDTKPKNRECLVLDSEKYRKETGWEPKVNMVERLKLWLPPKEK